MWPRTLDMSVDECRQMMRKIELETYSNVISTFRAQGVLDQKRMNILEELRSIFKIGQDRHRSEVRRATNDEQLTTIAEKLFGDDFIIQWTREGKRGAPLLYRSKPYTALTTNADEAANWARKMNRRLPQEPSKVKRRPAPQFDLPPKANVILADPSRSTPIRRPHSVVPPLLRDVVMMHRNAPEPSTVPMTPSKRRKVPGVRGLKAKAPDYLPPPPVSPPPPTASSSYRSHPPPVTIQPLLEHDYMATSTTDQKPANKEHISPKRGRIPNKKYSTETPARKRPKIHKPVAPSEILSPSVPNELKPKIATSKSDITKNLTKLKTQKKRQYEYFPDSENEIYTKLNYGSSVSLPIGDDEEEEEEDEPQPFMKPPFITAMLPPEPACPKVQIVSQTIYPAPTRPSSPVNAFQLGSGSILMNRLQNPQKVNGVAAVKSTKPPSREVGRTNFTNRDITISTTEDGSIQYGLKNIENLQKSPVIRSWGRGRAERSQRNFEESDGSFHRKLKEVSSNEISEIIEEEVEFEHEEYVMVEDDAFKMTDDDDVEPVDNSTTDFEYLLDNNATTATTNESVLVEQMEVEASIHKSGKLIW